MLLAGPLELTRGDRRIFRSWFTWLAEALYAMPAARRPRDVTDCSALLRFAYREALQPHTAEWARSLGLDWMPPHSDLSRPVRSGAVFRVSGQLRHFADAEHLMRENCHPVARDWARAQPGDLLFYRQFSGAQPWHGMVYLSRGAFDNSRQPMAVYHTGPVDGTTGEIRRPAITELLRHPEPRWRPVSGNGNFLGVYRWNILRESE
jgi:uncharacterized protein YfaT (DUF1175 family)